VGGGRIQWYAFLNIPPKSLALEPSEMCAWLKETQFSDWSAEVRGARGVVGARPTWARGRRLARRHARDCACVAGMC
jgi:hypothetical protein